MSATVGSLGATEYALRWNAARVAKEQHRRAPYGFLAYAGFHKLVLQPSQYDGIPGEWTTGFDGPQVRLGDGEHLVIDGDTVARSHRFAPIREREFRRVAQVGDVISELSKRGGQDLLRPIDPVFGARRQASYQRTPAYEPDPRWIIAGRFVPFGEIRPAALDATIGDIVHIHSAVGEAVFDLDGVEHRIRILVSDNHGAGTAGAGTIPFVDGTGGLTTDPRGRSLPVNFPAEAGPLTLDFNFAHNLQRPYTAMAPCPLPPAQNVLSAPVEAGEQLPVFSAGSRLGRDSGVPLRKSGSRVAEPKAAGPGPRRRSPRGWYFRRWRLCL